MMFQWQFCISMIMIYTAFQTATGIYNVIIRDLLLLYYLR